MMKKSHIRGGIWGPRQSKRFLAKRKKNRNQLNLEQLEDRVVLTAYVFVEFGDNFPIKPANGTRVLTTTVGAVRDVAAAQLDNNNNPIPNTVIHGPQLTSANNALPNPPGNNYADNTAVTFTSFNNTANQRAQMLAAARGAFASVDVTVVELTATAQTLADGRVVVGAASMAGMIATLRGNNTMSNDVYVVVATPGIGASNDNPNTFAMNSYGGIASTGTVLGEVTDLQSSYNRHDDLVLNFRNDANTIVHEAGHAFGLRHAVTTAAPAGMAINNAIHTSEAMSYLSDDNSLFFSRYPMVHGDSNTDGDASTNPPTAPLWNSNDLAARQGQQTPAEQLAVDPNIGWNPALRYASGTGSHDIITITRKDARLATVTVQAFADANYTSPIIVPGAAAATSTYSYPLSLDRPILVQGGKGNDRVVVAGNLGVRVIVDGMEGSDSLILRNTSLLITQYELSEGIAIAQIGGQFMTVIHNNLERVTVEASRSDTVNIIGVRTQTPVTVDAAKTVAVSYPGVQGDVSIVGRGRTELTVNDASTSPSDFRMRNNSLLAIVQGTTRQIDYTDLGSFTINGGSRGNVFTIDNTPTVPVTLNTGLGVDTVSVRKTQGALTINGQDSRIPNAPDGHDTVNIGHNGSVQSIRGVLRIENPGAYSAVNVDNSADMGARTGLIYKDRLDTVISGLTPPQGAIVLRGKDLHSLSIRAGNGGNTFRIHDTPSSNTPGGLTTTLSTGDGTDSVLVTGATGALALNGQGGANSFTVGETAGLNAVNGAIDVRGLGNANTLAVLDGASTASREYLVGRDFVQRLDKARIGFQNLSSLSLQTGAKSDRVIVEDTLAPIDPVGGTQILNRGGDDRIHVANTTGPLSIVAAAHSVVEVGNALSSLENIRGNVVVIIPFANDFPTLVLNDAAATTRQQLDIRPNASGVLFQRAGAADILAASNNRPPLGSFQWYGGSGGNTVNVQAQPATASTFTLGAGGNVVNVGTAVDMLFESGTMTVAGGEGTDQLLIRDQGTTASRRYDLGASQAVGGESFGGLSVRPRSGAINTMTVLYDRVESIAINAGSGGNAIKIAGTPAAAAVLLNTGAGIDTVDIASKAGSPTLLYPANSLRDVRGPLTINGQDGADDLILRDNGEKNARNYTLGPTSIVRSDAPAAPISYANIETLALKGSAGDNVFAMTSNDYATAISLDGGGGVNTLDYSAVSGGPGAGLVARYAGEGSAVDSVEGNDGALINGATFADGRIGQAFSFDGVDDYLQAPNAPGLESPTISVEAWVNSSVQDSRNAYILAKGASGVTAASYALYTGDAGGLQFYISDGQGYIASPDAGTGVWDGNWHHVVGAFDGDSVRLYVDGAEIGAGTQTLAHIGYNLPTTNDLFIGSYQGDVALPFGGLIDELSIYNRALDLAEIQARYSFGNVASAASWYPGEGSADDFAGANDGALHGDVSFVPGKVGQAFDFHAMDGARDYVDLGADASLDMPGSMSASMWVRLDSLDASKYFLADFDSTGVASQGALGTVVDATAFAWYQSYTDGTGETLASLTPIALAQWFHLAAVRDDDAKTVRLYVNGVEESSLSYTGKSVVPLQSNKVLGGSIEEFPADFIDGQLDEVGIYDRALSVAEIQALASAGGAGDTNGVVVNLRLGAASGVNGGVTRIQNVIGSAGNDILVGNGGNVLSGGAGRDLLIAGASASTLVGGDEEDLLIGGRTNYDANTSALLAILAEWTHDADYATRNENLKNGRGGAPILNASTVRSNGGGNTLLGQAGFDFFFANIEIDAMDWDPRTEALVEV